jgi:hypothetical protein
VSILAFGGEMGFFIPSDSSAIEETFNFNSSFARAATRPSGGACYVDSATFTETADIWIHVELIQHGSSTSSSTKQPLVVMLDASAVEQFRILADYSLSGDNNWQLQFKNGASWANLGAAFATNVDIQTLDFHIVCATLGSFTVYVSGTQRALSGTVDLSGISGVAQVRGRTVHSTAYSQIIVADEPTIGWKLMTVPMTGQGSTHTFTTGGFANIDETVYSDGDFIQSNTAAQVELFTGTPVGSFTGYTIRAVGVTARAKQSGAGPTKMRLLLRAGGTTYDNGSDITLDFGYGAYCAVWETNPSTAADFLSSEITALEYGVKSVT